MPLYKAGRRSSLIIEAGLFLYDRLGGMNLMPKAKKLSIQEVVCRARSIRQDGLIGGFEFSDAQMNDYGLGRWVASEAEKLGVLIYEKTEVHSVDLNGTIKTTVGDSFCFDRVLNVAGPWTEKILHQSGIDAPYKLDLIRGSHLVLTVPCVQPCLLEIPGERRIFFVLPWEEKTLLGTTEIRQSLEEQIQCSRDEQRYLLDAYRYYFPETNPVVTASFAGLRPLLKSSEEPGMVTREYAIHKKGKLVSVFGGKWTTAMALAEKVTSLI
jgi:glycerol-3-phosphate dehydrogenase